MALGLFAVALSAPAAAQITGAPAPSDPRYLDSRQRAERDLELLSQSAADLLSGAEAALGTPYGAAAMIALAAAFGGFLGGSLRGRRQPAPTNPARTRTGAGEARGAQARDPLAAEATRLFAFFRERFGLEEQSAEAAVEYLTRLGGSIEHLRQRAVEAERRADDAERRAERPRPTAEAEAVDKPTAMIVDAVRLTRAAMQEMRGDAEYDAFARAVGLDDAMRALSGLRGALQEGRGVVGGELIEEGWPHALFRAEALLATYYPAAEHWLDLRTGVAAASTGLRMLLRDASVDVAFVRLLGAFDVETGEKWSDSAEGLTELGPVRRLILSRHGDGREGQSFDNTVIDVESFGFVDHERGVSMRSRLILFNPVSWREPEWR